MAQYHLLDPVYDATHRGRLLAEELRQDLAPLRPRSHDGFLGMQYDTRYTPYLARAGLDVISFQVRRGLPTFNSAAITALVDRWRPETHSFHLPFGEMTVTLKDCQKLLGLRIRGRAVTGPCRSEGWKERAQVFLGREIGNTRARTTGVLINWLRSEFGQPHLATDDQIPYYCRAWILHLFATVLFPDATGDTASWMWIHCLRDWDQAGQYSWASAVLAFLYRQLCEACRRSSVAPSIGGCMLLLQLWMWDHIPVGRPLLMERRAWFENQTPRLQPTWAYYWDQVTVPHGRTERLYKEYTDEMDRLTASTVTWDPYSNQKQLALTFLVSSECEADEEIYRMKCPMIYFYAVEWHLPYRVARQFGLKQIWPTDPFSTGVDLHKFDRKKNRKIFDWHIQHHYFIEQWELMDANVDENEEPHNNNDFRQYQAWYIQGTRPRLRLQWTQADYADIETSEDEDTTYDRNTRAGRMVEAGPILDRVGNSLRVSIQDIEHFRPRVTDDDTRTFLDRLYRRLRRAAARCGCRTPTALDVQVPSTGYGFGSSEHSASASTGQGYSSYEDYQDNAQRQEEIGPSQLHGAPSTQPSQPRARRRRSPERFTPGSHALPKGKGKSRRR